MGISVETRKTARSQRADPQRSQSQRGSRVPGSAASPIHRLQQAVGNRAISHLLQSRTIQPKLTVSHPGDESEREANRVADQVMRMPDTQGLATVRGSNSGVVQRKCACDSTGGQPCECQQGTQTVQRRATSSAPVASIPSSVPQVLRASGRPLDEPTRNFMESRFGQDFSAVRVHTGGDATASAQSINAHAYTVGNNVVFGANQYQPATAIGRRLLAHELVHVLQQGSRGTVRLQRFACTVGVLKDPRCDDAQGAGHPSGVNLEHFSKENHTLKPAHKTQIKTFKAAWVKGGSKDDVKVHGYASCDGDADLNVQLSCDRAEAVKAELTAQGITTKITTAAHGETDEFGKSLDGNRRAIIESIAPSPPPSEPKPGLCKGVPTATPADCVGRNGGYCAAAACFPSDPWLQCVCKTSIKICEAIDAFSFTSVQGKQLEFCIDATVKVPANLGAKFETNSKGNWFRDTNKCIWGHWREALDALHDPSVPIPAGATAPWKTAISVCRSKGVGSSDCCKAQVDAEQQAIDTCGPYDSSRFGSQPTDIPFSPACSAAAKSQAPPPPFSGDFGKVADRVAHGLKLCCP